MRVPLPAIDIADGAAVHVKLLAIEVQVAIAG